MSQKPIFVINQSLGHGVNYSYELLSAGDNITELMINAVVNAFNSSGTIVRKYSFKDNGPPINKAKRTINSFYRAKVKELGLREGELHHNKTCVNCLETKSVAFFNKDRTRITGYRSDCKQCRKELCS